MSKRELFEAHVHAMACAVTTAEAGMYHPDEWVAKEAIKIVRAVDAALAEIPHAEEPEAPKVYPAGPAFGYTEVIAGAYIRGGQLVTGYRPEEPTPAPLAWRPMSEISQATGRVVIATRTHTYTMAITEGSREESKFDLAWIQLPPLPTGEL